MKVISRHQKESHKARERHLSDHFDQAKREALEEHAKIAPQPITLKHHPEGKAPLELGDDVTVMPGDYYYEGDDERGPFAVAAHAVGEGKDWEPVA